MSSKSIALALVLVLGLSVTVTAEGVCDKHTMKTYTIAGNTLLDPMPVPDTTVYIPDSGHYYLKFSKLTLKDIGWGPELQMTVTYCNKDTNKPEVELEMMPGTAFDLRVGEPRVGYYGPYGVESNVRCLGVAEAELTPLNKLFYSSMFAKSSGFEQLYFKKLVSRHAQIVKQSVAKNARQPLARKTSVKRTPPTVLGDPEVDPDAQNACFVKVYVHPV